MMKRNVYVWCAAMALVVVGAAGCKQPVRGFLGVSTDVLEDGRADAVKKVIGAGIDKCYKQAEASLKNAKAYIYARSPAKYMIAVYVSETDTTPVGVFMTIAEGGTLVEVSSPSAFAKDDIAEKLFADLEKENAKVEPKKAEPVVQAEPVVAAEPVVETAPVAETAPVVETTERVEPDQRVP